MSSTYRILCLSHDPAIIIETPDWNRPTPAEEAIHAGIEGHEQCDLMIGRYSYTLVELGCPRSADLSDQLRPNVLHCYHASTSWTDTEWLLLLAAAYQSDDPKIQAAIKAGSHHCLPWERLRRLHDELGITHTAPAPEPAPTAHDNQIASAGIPIATALRTQISASIDRILTEYPEHNRTDEHQHVVNETTTAVMTSLGLRP